MGETEGKRTGAELGEREQERRGKEKRKSGGVSRAAKRAVRARKEQSELQTEVWGRKKEVGAGSALIKPAKLGVQ